MGIELGLVFAAGVLALAYGAIQFRSLMAASAGDEKMQEIAAAIQEGANAYLRRQYTTIAVVGAVVFVLVFVLLGFFSALGFLLGSVLSGAAGFIGMLLSVRANVRTTEASKTSLAAGLSIAFRSGAVTGMLVAGLALLGVAGYYAFLTGALGLEPTSREVVVPLVLLGFGASLISVFARLGGGIFTKGADVGGDMVGKVEAGIPEDDRRNAATIADNVGDNVGDCAGMAADLFETYAVTVVATMVLASIMFLDVPGGALPFMMLPLVIAGGCIAASVAGTFFVRLGASNNVMNALYKGFVASAVFSIPVVWAAVNMTVGFDTTVALDDGRSFNGMSLMWCGLVGLVVTGAIVWVTEYYTGVNFRPVRSVAKASESGHGTNVIQGLAVSMEATALPAIAIIVGILVAFNLAGLYGIAIAVTTMLALAGMV
ncbi:MAG: sodium/proton-translocating pyrophosphatase, partial [Caulobacterales bacterium]|nr:sodium/proton-translocating pyrophosphatase [Caulobacterales bacterium]